MSSMVELNIDNEAVLLNKYNLSPNEFYAMKCLLLFQINGESKYLQSYFQLAEETRGNFRSILLSLQKKSLIIKDFKIPGKGENLDLLQIPFNKSFIKSYCRNSLEMGKELFEVYPKFGTINGNVVSLRTVASKFNSLEDAFKFYAKTIHYNNETHHQILQLVKWASDNDVLNMSLSSFIVNNSWLDLNDLKEGKIGKYNLNSVKLL